MIDDPKQKVLTVTELELEIAIKVPREKAWKALTEKLHEWWPKDFCMNPERTEGFHLEFRLGGRMYEDWGNGDGWIWWTIYRVEAAKFLFGASGLSTGLMSAVEFSLHEAEGGSTLKISESVWGTRSSKDVIRIHTEGWTKLFGEGFKPYAEKKYGR
jgi:uncharacterized protein YndB with AHSA1/START domain